MYVIPTQLVSSNSLTEEGIHWGQIYCWFAKKEQIGEILCWWAFLFFYEAMFPYKFIKKIQPIKVHIFREGNKILRNLHCRFDWHYIGQIYGGDFAKFCGLLKIYIWILTHNMPLKMAYGGNFWLKISFSLIVNTINIFFWNSLHVQSHFQTHWFTS